MHGRLLTIGLFVILAGFFVLYQGPQILLPVAQEFGFVSQIQNEIPLYAPTLINVPASNYTFLAADLKGGVVAQGSLQVGDGREIAFYGMDEGNFSQWKRGQPGVLVIAQPFTSAYNFSFAPNAGGRYYFIFDNQDSSRCTVVFSLSLIETTTVLNPIMEFAGYELLAIGVILSILAVRGGKEKTKPPPAREIAEATVWKCRFCGAQNPNDITFCEKCGRSQR